ncbi:MAG: ABC-F family ATP-binding cassette domain-containing protein, partial [Abditibacteriota bacterium]|nr:ABC-F family ATP-binding cassette domain-containing protein [Abditibacteriota bacterium]
MSVISCRNISKSFGGRLLFENVSFLAEKSSRKALIGDNGTGKSTIMKMLAGELAPDSGSVTAAPGALIGYLPQDSGFEGDFELLGSVACGTGELARSLSALRSREEALQRDPASN